MAKEKPTAGKKAARSPANGSGKGSKASRGPSTSSRTVPSPKKSAASAKNASSKSAAGVGKPKPVTKNAKSKPAPVKPAKKPSGMTKPAAKKTASHKPVAAKPAKSVASKPAASKQAAAAKVVSAKVLEKAKPARDIPKPVAAKTAEKAASKAPAAAKGSAISIQASKLNKANNSPKQAAKSQATTTPEPAIKRPIQPTIKPVLKPNRLPVAGVLQAARSVASRTTKVVEIQSTRRSHLTPEEMDEFRTMLLNKRRELVEDMVNLEGEAKRSGEESGSASSSMPIHMADLGSDTWEQEFTLNLIEKGRSIVREIDEALDRIENKTYGTCLATGKAIAKARLRVKPWAKYCIEYARKREMGLG